MSDFQTLQSSVNLRRNVQKLRISLGNQLDAERRGVSDNGRRYVRFVETFYTKFVDIESTLTKDIARRVKEIGDEYPLFPALTAIRGIGPQLAAELLNYIDFSRANTPSSLWKLAGYAPGYDRKIKGQRIAYNADLRTLMYLVGASFLKSRSPYRDIYDNAVARYKLSRPDWTPRHRSLAAMRKMNKRFLVHLYLVGRTMNGLPVRRPYVEAHLGHSHIDRPEDYGWPELTYQWIDEHDQTRYESYDDEDAQVEYELIEQFSQLIDSEPVAGD